MDSQARTTAPSDHFAIAIIGAGPGGICAAIKLRQAGFHDFVVLERADSVGGTWHNNRYPGLACDVPSLLYSFSFEFKVDWTRVYANQREILDYMRGIVEKYDLTPKIRLGSGVTRARWSDEARQWTLSTYDGKVVTANSVISALGMFTEVATPDLPVLAGFKGKLLHTAQWPFGESLSAKRVAVVGTAASAVQMIPELVKQTRQMYVFQRTANWVMPKGDKPVTDDERAHYRAHPEAALKIRMEFFDFFEKLVLYNDQAIIDDLTRQALDNVGQVKDPVVREKLTPRVPWGSQRPLFSSDYYPVFNRADVELVTEAIEGTTENGVRSADGKVREVDIVILATGYAANKYLGVIDVVGRNGRALKDAWKEGPQAYKGMTTTGFPNLFMLYGPNTNNGSILTMLEFQVDYVVGKLKHMREKGIEWIDVRQDAMDDYNEKLQLAINAVGPWKAVGSKYYRVDSGRIVTQWPYTMRIFEQYTREPDMASFEASTAETAAA